MKGSGTTFQSPVMSQKMLHFDSTYNLKEISISVHYVAMPMMSQILKSVDFTKRQKSRYLQNETLFFFSNKKFINYTSRDTLWQKIVLKQR